VEADAGLAIFLDAAGLDASRIPAGQEAELLKLAGTMFRQLIEDLREVLIARALLKSGLRMEVTRIAPTDNNPLKFSAGGAEEALEKLLYKRGKGYMDPVQAIHEGFQDIKEHQLAMVAGVKAAAAAVIARFDPKRLEQEFEAKGGVGLLSSRKARNWELFEELYAQLKAAADDGRDEAFTDAFGSAYEEQIESLRKSRAG
jgi:type VI secretion system FHA domain protein